MKRACAILVARRTQSTRELNPSGLLAVSINGVLTPYR